MLEIWDPEAGSENDVWVGDMMAGEKDGVMTLRLTAIHYGAHEMNIYELRHPEGKPLAPFTAGSHVDVHLLDAMVRQYSLMNDPAEQHRYLLGIKLDRQGRGGSAHIHGKLRVGDLIRIGAPRNNFALEEGGAPVILIGGGIGITPMIAMAHRARTIGLDLQFHQVVRTREDLLNLDQWLAGAGAIADIHIDAEQGGRLFDLRAVFQRAPSGAHVYCCGPAPMLDAFTRAAEDFGWPANQVHIEHFSAAPIAPSDKAFDLLLAKSGRSFCVQKGETIVEVLREAGIDVEVSCEQGICGACETRIVSGIADHKDMILSDAEKAAGQTMMICCSGALSDTLILDL
ncbi:PDR/VanB family oxidoreductase [Sphingopyxis kveilinensis]|uniref:PDR/VanB family oxidoreductase n=1 Tax=Sphingopyxis kveilinensis TaxID=3114367 RepID=UPI0030D323D9